MKSPDHMPPVVTDEEESGIDVRRYLEVLRKRKWVILATVAAGITAMVLWTSEQTKIYQATATMIINPQAPQVFGKDIQEVVQLGTGTYWANQEYYNTQIQIIKGYELATQAVLRHQLYNDAKLLAGIDMPHVSQDRRTEIAANRLHVAVDAAHGQESRIVRVNVRNPDSDEAATLANDVVDTYIASNLEVRAEPTDAAAKFLSGELDKAEADLKKSEQAIYDWRKKNDLLSVSLSDKLNLISSNLTTYTGAYNTAHINLINIEAKRKRAREALKTFDNHVLESPIFALAEDTAADALKAQYITERQQWLDISNKLGPKNPEYVATKKKLGDLHAALEQEAQLAMKKLDEEYEAAADSEQQFSTEVTKLKKQAIGLGPAQMQYDQLKRDEDATQQNYKILTDRLRASQLSSKNTLGNVQPQSPARGGVLVYPRMKFNVIAAAFLSLLLGLGLAFGLEYLDRTLTNPEDVERWAKSPLLGLIPMVDEIEKTAGGEVLQNRDLHVFKHPTSRAAECCRSIRTNILFSAADRELKLLAVSSPNPKEGKTTTAIYLGTTMAQSGQRVLIVDTDLRRPRLHRSLGVPRTEGITNLIVGESSYDEAIKSTDVPNLFVLPCGPTPPNPAELLLTNRFAEILAEVRPRFDRIILDSPPLQAVTDAVVLARLSDAAVLVAQAGKTVRDDLARAARQLRDVDAHIIGVILNNLDVSNRKYGYYYYQYSYGDGEAGASAPG